jgi:hypothetical protein
MATDLEQKPRPAAKYDTFVEEQLTKVRGRVRALDAGKITLLLLIITLGYALGMAVADRAWTLPAGFRLGAFLIYLVIALGLVGWIVLCLARRINPYYAAKKLEETLPDAKNSVVNWLDLRDEKLPPVIHNALGTRAAKDLKQADPERAVSAGPTWILAGIMAGLILGLLILFVMGPTQFGSLLLRAFTPFRERVIDTRVSITMVQPVDGNATVSPNRPVTFRATIEGPVPAINKKGAPHLHYRFSEADPFVPQPLDVDADGSTWSWTMPADRVLNGGLWYKITAGDAETPEYLIRVVPNPQVLQIQVTYHYRKFLCKPDASVPYPKSVFTELHAPRGTEVTLVVQTNSPVKNGWLQVDWSGGKKEEIKGELLAADPNAMRFAKIFLDKGGFFRINFTSGSEDNIDRDPYRIVVYEHGKPRVQLTKPGANIELPPYGTLVLEGSANTSHPEIGIQNMTLQMRARLTKDAKDATPLEPKPYRPGKSFKLVNDKYPPALKYMDVVVLEKLKTANGVPFPLAKGMEVEYWLEARDNTDYPDKNGAAGESDKFKVTIIDPEKDKKKQEQDRKQAKKEQEQHEKQQNQDLDKQNKQAKDDQEKNKTQAQKDEDKLKKEKDRLNEEAKKLKDKMDKEKEKDKGEAKGQEQKEQQQEKASSKPGNSDPKNDPQPKNAKAKDNNKGQENASQNKEGPKDGKPDNNTEAKGPGQNDSTKKDPASQAKESGEQNPETGPKGTAKDDKINANQEKSAAKDQPEKQSGRAKDQGSNQPQEKTGKAKGPEDMKSTDPKTQCNCKEAGKEQPGGQAKGSKESAGNEQSAKKGDTKKGPGPKNDKSQAKGKEAGSETKVSEGKKGPVDDVKDAKGLTKGDDSLENQSGAKGGNGGEKGPPPLAKGAGNDKKGPPPTAAKEKTEQTKDAGQAKDENGPRKQPTAKDIEKWIKDLAQKHPEIQEKAERDLRNATEARDPNVRDAAQEALEKANKTAMKVKGRGQNSEKTSKAEPKDKGNQGEGQGQAKQGNNQEGGQGKGDPGPKDIAQAKGGDKAGSSGPGARGMSDDPKAKPPDESLGKRGGELTLEDLKSLKDKMTAEKRKKAGISDEEWQRFLKGIQDYEDMLRRQQAQTAKNPDKSKGIGSVLKTFNPKILNPMENPNVDPLNTGRFLPPPEVLDAPRRFTQPPALPEKK